MAKGSRIDYICRKLVYDAGSEKAGFFVEKKREIVMSGEIDRTWILQLLRGDLTGENIAAELGVSVEEVEARRQAYLKSKLPRIDAEVAVPVGGTARVRRDRWGVAHVEAESLEDGCFALGYAMGQDRLWQLDYLRRRVRGRLAEVLGRSWLGSDRLLRTVGLGQAAEVAAEQLEDEAGIVLEALAGGINAAAEAAQGNLPVEFELLGYGPEPWRPADSIALWKWRWWMLTGRLELIALEEACKRYLPEELRAIFQEVEAGEETIVPGEEPGSAVGHDTGEGSNNWVVGGSRSASGKPVLATDPHNALDHPSQWYEAQLTAPGIDAVGAFYLGTPGIYLGHTRRTAWGVTNHTASGRDLYAETVDAGGERYREGDGWVPFEVEKQEIPVRGGEAYLLEIRRTTRGPVVNGFLTSVAEEGDPPLSLRWAGSGPETGFAAMLRLMRSTSVDEVLAALGQWPFPNLNFVFADADGRIGYHAAGTVPLRQPHWRGFRPVGEVEHSWDRVWEFDALPQLVDPERDWVATANNPPWPGAGDYVSLGSWADGYRFRRIRERIEAQEKLDMEAVAAIQGDVQHARARELAGAVAAVMRECDGQGFDELAKILESWDGRYDVDEVGPSLFEAFWNRWLERIARVHFPERWVAAAAGRAGSVGRRLLLGEELGWFPEGTDVRVEMRDALEQGVAWLGEIAGPQREYWRWGQLHRVRFPHPLGKENSALDELLSPGPFPTSGGTGTVRAAGFSTAQRFAVTGGSTYRMVVDMARPERAWSTTTGGSSGHPCSPHYADQTRLWLEDRYHPLVMDVDAQDVEGTLELVSL